MKKINNLIPIGKEESCQVFGGGGHWLAEAIGAGLGRFARGVWDFLGEMTRGKDFVSYR